VLITHLTNEVVVLCGNVFLNIIFIFVFYQFHSLNRENGKNSQNCPIKVVQNKNASVWNLTQKVHMTAHHLYHRANDD